MPYTYTEANPITLPAANGNQSDRIAQSFAEAEAMESVETFMDDSGYTQAVASGPPRAAAPQPATSEARDPSPRRVHEAFALEKQDAKHRMGNYLQILFEAYSKIQPRHKLQFFNWVDAINVVDFKRHISTSLPKLAVHNLGWWSAHLNDFQKGVKYKGDGNVRGKYLIKVEGGLLMRRGKFDVHGKWNDTGKLEPFCTTDLSSHWNGNGWAMWVESPTKEFYANRMKVMKFQHTSFLAGGLVSGAGEWVVEHGLLKSISGRSGHYQPTLDHLLKALRDLQLLNVIGLDNVDVVLYRRTSYSSKSPEVVKWKDLKAVAQPNALYKVDPAAA